MDASNYTAIFLCDLTGIMAAPWVEAGYNVILVDPQHAADEQSGKVTKLAKTILEAMPTIAKRAKDTTICFVFGFPPCTDVSVSGARWFKQKEKKDKFFQTKAALIAEQCRMVGECYGAAWGFENPVSVFSSIFGKSQHTFSPEDFTGYCADDNYTKKTCVWAGNGFVMPKPFKDNSLGAPDDRIHKAPPGPERSNFRSATPRGFAMAAYLSNAPHLKSKGN